MKLYQQHNSTIAEPNFTSIFSFTAPLPSNTIEQSLVCSCAHGTDFADTKSSLEVARNFSKIKIFGIFTISKKSKIEMRKISRSSMQKVAQVPRFCGGGVNTPLDGTLFFGIFGPNQGREGGLV